MEIDKLIERERDFIDRVCDTYNYDSNIRHLLYIIIPAFIIKYGYQKEKLILDTLNNIKIVSSNNESKEIKAYYTSTLRRINDNYLTDRFMVIENYSKNSLIDLLDNLIHEFNHALNSSVNEVKVTNKYIYLRTGLTYRIYNKDNLKFIKKDSSYLLEEIINTKQTEDVINIIKQFNINKSIISNAIYAINSETSKRYSSASYQLETYICKKILNNKTFINTLEKLRITGEVYNIKKWFDDITGDRGSYQNLIILLNEIFNLENLYLKRKILKFSILKKMKKKFIEVTNIIETFDRNVNIR